MQQEDDLRALAKIMDILRAVSIILVVMRSKGGEWLRSPFRSGYAGFKAKEKQPPRSKY